mgnify:CR=1 FL=1|tara:strand:+ start:603 stop:839 length:237 start_codon:yes stop_codon:yes gene_type:complete
MNKEATTILFDTVDELIKFPTEPDVRNAFHAVIMDGKFNPESPMYKMSVSTKNLDKLVEKKRGYDQLKLWLSYQFSKV